MKRLFFVLAVCAVCSIANADLILNVPSQTLTTPSSQFDFPIDVGFVITPPTGNQALVGYDLYLKVTTSGGSGFSIIGVGTGADRPANCVFSTDPAYTVINDPTDGTLYNCSDYLSAGTGTITNGSALLRVKARLQPGATGTYNIAVFTNPSNSLDPLNTQFYSGYDIGLNPIPITGMISAGGTITIVPEPSTLLLLCTCGLVAGLFGLRRRV
jgi:hypothetical protein